MSEVIEKKGKLSADWLRQRIFVNVEEQVYYRGRRSVYIIHAKNEQGLIFEGVGFATARSCLNIDDFSADKGRRFARNRALDDLWDAYRRYLEAKNKQSNPREE